MEQLQLSDDRSTDKLTIKTTAQTIKPFVDAVRKITAEARIHFEPERIYVNAVDPANTHGIEIQQDADAHAEYNLCTDSLTVGVDLKQLRGTLRMARRAEDDSITIQVGEECLQTQVDREYEQTKLRTRNEMILMEPDAVREVSDIPDVDGLQAEYYQSNIKTTPLCDGVEHVLDAAEVLRIHSDTEDLIVESFGEDETATAVRYEGKGDCETSGSIFSERGVENLLASLKKTNAQNIVLKYAQEHPLYIRFETEAETGLEGKLMMAPRVPPKK